MILQGERISIKPVTWDDLPSLCEWWNNPVVMREVRVNIEKLKPELKQIQEKSWPVWQNPKPEQFHMFIIWKNEERIGEIGYTFEDTERGIVSVDIKIGEPSLWGQGLGTEAMRLLVSYLFEEMGARSVIARPGDWNTRSKRLFEKCGFWETGRQESPANFFFEGGISVNLQLDKE